jgi:hypothetical protein
VPTGVRRRFFATENGACGILESRLIRDSERGQIG